MKFLLPILASLLVMSCRSTPPYPPQHAQPYRLADRNGISSDISAAADITYSRGSSAERIIALTFDDGPHPTNTPRLLNILRQYDVPATFFVIGNLVDRYPAIARRIVEEGHEIGNHTYTHANLSKLPNHALHQELQKGREAIIRATGTAPQILRPPYGALKTQQRLYAKYNFGYPTILWNVDPLDWKRPGVQVVANRLVAGATNGGILLAHDLHSTTVDAIPSVLSRLKAQGYRFVTVSQLINRAEALKAATPVPAQR